MKNLVGNRTFYYPYTSAQARLTVYDENGRSRYCYTAPFDLDRQKGSGTEVSFNYFNACPTITETKLDKVEGANIYQSHSYGSQDIVKSGVQKAYLKIKPDPVQPYQYSWYIKDGKYYVSNICDSDGCGIWNLSQTFDQHKTKDFDLTPSAATYYDKQGMLLSMDKNGNVKPCYTGIYNSLPFNKKYTINQTNVYFDKNFNYDVNSMFNLLKNFPENYLAASNIYFLSSNNYARINTLNSCGVAYSGIFKIEVRDRSNEYDGCDYDFSKYTVAHELGHTIDYMYEYLNGVRLSKYQDIVNYKDNYTGSIYLRDYAYTNYSEFWAELFANNYVKNSSDFNGNAYKNMFKLDSNLINLMDRYNKDIIKTYNSNKNKWYDLKKRYQ